MTQHDEKDTIDEKTPFFVVVIMLCSLLNKACHQLKREIRKNDEITDAFNLLSGTEKISRTIALTIAPAE